MPNHSFRASVRPTNWYIVVSRGSGTVEQQVKSPVKDVTLLQSRGNFESGTKGAFMNGTYIISATQFLFETGCFFWIKLISYKVVLLFCGLNHFQLFLHLTSAFKVKTA